MRTQVARLEARLSPDVYDLLKRAAQIEGRTLSDFVVNVAREAARKTIAEVEIIRLSLQDQKRIAELILDPPAPAPALLRAVKAYHKLVEPQ